MNMNINVFSGKVNLENYQMQGYIDAIEKINITDHLGTKNLLKCIITLNDQRSITTDTPRSSFNIILNGVDPEKIINNSSIDTLKTRIITDNDRKLADAVISSLFAGQCKVQLKT